MANPMPNPENVIIDTAKADDVPIIKSIINAANSKYLPRLSKPPGPMTADYTKLVETGNVYVLRNSSSSNILGSITLSLSSSNDSLKINNLVVDVSAQGKGYGRMLMGFAEEMARGKGLRVMEFFTNEKMWENLEMYGKMGFLEVRRGEDDGHRRVYFRKEVG